MGRGRYSAYPVVIDEATGERVKYCPSCDRARSIDKDEFGTRVSPSTGNRIYLYECRECHAATVKRYRTDNIDYHEREAARQRRRRKSRRTEID